MNISAEDYSVTYSDSEHTIIFSGSLRLLNLKEYEPVKNLLKKAHEDCADTLTLDFKDLKFLNSSGITAISTFIISARKEKKLKITVIGSTHISWQEKSLQNLNKLWDEVTINML